MLSLRICLLAVMLARSQTSKIIYLHNCTYVIDLYKQYLNLLWSANDSRTVHLQAVYSLATNQTLTPGHIYPHLSQSVALIPFFVHCKHPAPLASKPYLPFAHCSSTITNLWTRSNHESTRTYLNLKSVLGMAQVPLVYTGEYNLLLSNCSFEFHGSVYQLTADEPFTFRVEYESAIDTEVNACHTCNQRTSTCEQNRCVCRSGTIPSKLHRNHAYCVDGTSNCSYDAQRCFRTRSINILSSRSTAVLFGLIAVVCLLTIVFLFLFWCLLHGTSTTHSFEKQEDHSSNPSIFMVNRHERTPSTISTTDSTKLSDFNQIDQYILTNEYVSTSYEEYPKIFSDKSNGEIVLILA